MFWIPGGQKNEKYIDALVIQPGAYPSTDLFSKLIPADNPSAAQTYGKFGSRIKLGIDHLFAFTPESPEPIEVAALLAEIIDAPQRERKLWYPVGIGEGEAGVEGINEGTHQFSLTVQSALGMLS